MKKINRCAYICILCKVALCIKITKLSMEYKIKRDNIKINYNKSLKLKLETIKLASVTSIKNTNTWYLYP